MKTALKTEIGGKPLSIETGKVAKQASGAVVVQYGDTIAWLPLYLPKKNERQIFCH